MGWLTSGRPERALWAAALVLLVSTCLVMTATANPRGFFLRQLSETSSWDPSKCYTKTSCTCGNSCLYECSLYPPGGNAKPTCTNVFSTTSPPYPTLVSAFISATSNAYKDGDLCSGWDSFAATELAPMYDGGDCSKKLYGMLYAFYDCNSNTVCLKATSCVGCTPSKGCAQTAGCGSQDPNPPVCTFVNNTSPFADNWIKLHRTCGDKSKTATDITTASTKGFPSGWEFCQSADRDQLYGIQAHFDVVITGQPGGKTVSNQFPASDDQSIIFQTPKCDGCISNPETKLSPPGPVCATENSVDVIFSYAGSAQVQDPTTDPSSTSASALDSNSQLVQDVACTVKSVDTTKQEITVNCKLAGSGTFASSDTTFAQVKLTWTPTDTCGQTVTPATAQTATVTLAPYLAVTNVNPPKVCSDQAQVTITFPYVAKHASGNPTFTVTSPTTGCEEPQVQQVSGSSSLLRRKKKRRSQVAQLSGSTVSVTCTTTAAKDGVTLHGKVYPTAPCTSPAEADANSAAFDVIPKATLDITADKLTQKVCYVDGITKVSADFNYTATNAAALPAWTTRTGCNATDDTSNMLTSGKVTVTCPVTTDGTNPVDVNLKLSGTANSTSPCTATHAGPASTTATVDSKPIVDVSLVGTTPSNPCNTDELKATFLYNITADVGSVIEATFTTDLAPANGPCTMTPDITSTMATATATGQVQVTCPPGSFAVGATPNINLTIKVHKKDCTYQVVDSAIAQFGKLLCCKASTCYAALVAPNSPLLYCFKKVPNSGTTCATTSQNWGFYINGTAANDYKLIAGGGNDCTKGTPVVNVTANCVPAGTGYALTITVKDDANFVPSNWHRYVGCKAVSTCTPPSYGGTSAACGAITATSSCGGNWPAAATTAGSFTVNFSGCDCDHVVWVVHQSGTFKGDPDLGQCS